MYIPILHRARAWLPALALAVGTLLLAPDRAAAQSCTEEPCGPIGFTPPTISISPSSGTKPGGALNVRIDFSDDYALDHGSLYVEYGYQNVTSAFTYHMVNGWTAYATGTVNVSPGSTLLTAEVCDASASHNCGYAQATYTGPAPSVRVSPEVTAASVAPASRAAARFRVVNTGSATTTYTMITPCPSGFTSCTPSVPTAVLAAGDSTWVDVGFTPPASSGTGWIQLSAASGSVSSFGGLNVSVAAAPDPGFPGDARSLERIARGACVTISLAPAAASECGDLRVAHALPSTRVLGKARTPVLTYNSDHARPQPIVAEHLAGPAGTVPDSIRAVLLVNGTQVATQRWKGWGADQTRRIAISFDASNPAVYPTGVYSYTLQVTGEWLGGTQQSLKTRSGRMIIVNRGASPFGMGWWLSGVEQLVTLPGDTVKLWVGGDGSAHLYHGNPGGPWYADAYDRPDSLYVGISGELGPVTVRTLPNKSEVWFDAQGRHLRTINRMQQYTGFRWNGGYLEQVITPYAPAQGDTARYVFEYNNNPAAAVRNLSRVVAPGVTASAPRYAWVNTDVGGKITRITDPDSAYVTYLYHSTTRWMNGRTDRRRASHSFGYSRVRFHTSARVVSTGVTATTRVQAAQTLGMSGVSVSADSVHVIYDGPRPGTEVCDCIWWKVDRWGAPTSMRNTLGQVTTYRRGDARWPALVTETVAPNGFSSTAVYDARGNLSSSTAWNPYGDDRDATTTYSWDPFWNAPTRVVTPEGQLSMTAYDAFGRRAWEQVGTDSVRRVRYGYLPANHASAPYLLETVTDPRGGVDRFAYDTRGNVSSATNPLLVTTEYLSDRLGRVVRVRVPVQAVGGPGFQVDSTVYDVVDQARETIATGPAMNGVAQQWLHVRNTYDLEGNVTQVERWSLPDAADVDTLVTRFEYDLAGRKIVEIAADSTPLTWDDNPRDSTFYDLAGNVVRVRTRRFAESLAASPADTAGAYIRMQYDAANRLTQRILPAVRYAARNEGMVTRIFLGMALHPYPYYPNDGTGLRIPADTSTFAYDPVTGQQDLAVNANARVRRLYYRNGQMRYDSLYTRTVAAATFDTHKYGTEYRYDRAGRVTEMRHPAQLLPPIAAGQGQTGNRYGYDAVTGALSYVTDPMGNTFRYYYNARGEPDSLVLPGGITQRYTYNIGGQLERHRISNAVSGGSRYTGTVLRDETLGYDARGKMVWARNLYGLRDTLTVSYSGLGQMAGSSHKYWGWFTDTGQNTSYLAGETPVHDALGNIVSINRTGALQVYGSGLLEASQGRRNYTNGAFGYQPQTGRLMERAEPGQYEFTTYDAGGNTVFTTAAPGGMDGGELLDRASFYDGGGRLWAVDVRRVESGTSKDSPQYFTFEDYRLDALGRRVLVRARKFCDRVGDDRICSMSSVRRTVWAGDQELYEIQMPDDGQGENDTGLVGALPRYDNGFDPNLFWGRVAYTYGGAIDQPLSIVRMGYANQQAGVTNGFYRWDEFAVIPHWNAHGKAQSGTFHDGARFRCRAGYTNWCVQLEWSAGLFPYNPYSRVLEHWHGTLLTEKRDASGLLYRRNRYYDPGTGRFTQEDPIGLAGGVNSYGFAAGDPVSYSDPYGLCPKEAEEGSFCLDFFIAAAHAGPFRGDGRGFNANADPSESRAQFVVNQHGEMTFAHVSPSHGPLGEAAASAWNEYGVEGRDSFGGFTVSLSIENSAMYGFAPAIDARVRFSPDGGGGWNININRDRMPSFGLYHRVDGQWKSVYESKEVGALQLMPFFPNERASVRVRNQP